MYVKESTVVKFEPSESPTQASRHLANETSGRQLEEQLLQSQRLEALGTLVGGIAHDFNNILNVISGHVSLMERWRENPERFKKSFEAVNKATKRGAQTARQLLTSSRKVEVVTEQVRIGDVIEELVRLLREIFPEKIVFNMEIENNIPIIPADSNRIHQALLNLCMNASDAIQKDGTISIVAKNVGRGVLKERFREIESDQYVQVKVSDSGSGIDKETLSHIFEPFFTTKKDGRGTGLGLWVVNWIIKAHNGFIDVESKVGHGTTFSLYFPILPQILDAVPEEKKKIELPKGHGEVILAIEDEEPLREFLKAILEESGYKVLLASDGTEGLEAYTDHQNEIDLVLLDMGLPELSGAEVLARLVLLNPHVKVISSSGYVQPEVRADAFEIGALEFLPKPYLPEELLVTVNRILQAGADTTG